MSDEGVDRDLFSAVCAERDLAVEAAREIAKAARAFVNTPLPMNYILSQWERREPGRYIDLDREHPYWVNARNVRATLNTFKPETGVDGDKP